jgi:hypothetical protein
VNFKHIDRLPRSSEDLSRGINFYPLHARCSSCCRAVY